MSSTIILFSERFLSLAGVASRGVTQDYLESLRYFGVYALPCADVDVLASELVRVARSSPDRRSSLLVGISSSSEIEILQGISLCVDDLGYPRLPHDAEIGQVNAFLIDVPGAGLLMRALRSAPRMEDGSRSEQAWM